MQRNPQQLLEILKSTLGKRLRNITIAQGEVTIDVDASSYLFVMRQLKENEALFFEQLIDLTCVDYLHYGKLTAEDVRNRFAVVVHLLSLTHNCRLRVKVFLNDTKQLLLPSVTQLWPSANWFEREVFDLFGVLFTGHRDMRRILTDYGFVGHPLRKDFPVQGFTEVVYDEQEKRVVYRPVSISPKEAPPRVIRQKGEKNV